MPFYICPNCKERSLDSDGREGFLEQAVACRRCGFGFLFELMEDYYPAPGAGYRGGDYRRESITWGSHHKKLYSTLTRRTSTNPACTRLQVRVFVRADYQSFFGLRLGQPIKIDTNRVDPASGRVQGTHTNGVIWLTR